MHRSVLAFLKANISAGEIRAKRVLEVGSQDVNGTPRPVVLPLGPSEYIGVDSEKGPGVDIVSNADALSATFGEESFDVVISTEMLEHLVDWRPVVQQLKAVLRKEGLLLVTTRSPGFPYHPYPIDVWRYTEGDFKAVFSDMSILKLTRDPMVPGIFLKAKKPASFRQNDLSKIEVHRV